MNEINNTQTDNTKEIDVTIPMYNLTENSNNYSKTSERLTLIWVGFLGVRFEVGGGVKFPLV